MASPVGDLLDDLIEALRDYIADLGDAVDAAETAAAALAIHDQVKLANDFLAVLIKLKFETDDAVLNQQAAAIKAKIKKLDAFKDKLDQYVKDVAIAAKILGTLARLAAMAATL